MFERFDLDFVVFSSFLAIGRLGGGEFMGNIAALRVGTSADVLIASVMGKSFFQGVF